MATSYSSLCDDFSVEMYINTKFDLPSERDTLLAFFDRVRKQYPAMTSLLRDNNSEYCLEEDRCAGQNRWVSLDVDRVGVGFLNPPSFEQAFELNSFIADLVPYMLGINSLDIESVDLTFAMDFDYCGNHNQIIAEAFFGGSPFADLFDMPGPGPISLSPGVVVAVSDDCSTKVRLSVDSKTHETEIKRKKYDPDKPISMYLTVRQYPQAGKEFDMLASLESQQKMLIELMDEKIIPNFIMPLTTAIAQRR